MDHEDGVIRVDHEHNLEKPAPSPRAPHQILLVVLDEWKWRPSAADNILTCPDRCSSFHSFHRNSTSPSPPPAIYYIRN